MYICASATWEAWCRNVTPVLVSSSSISTVLHIWIYNCYLQSFFELTELLFPGSLEDCIIKEKDAFLGTHIIDQAIIIEVPSPHRVKKSIGFS